MNGVALACPACSHNIRTCIYYYYRTRYQNITGEHKNERKPPQIRLTNVKNSFSALSDIVSSVDNEFCKLPDHKYETSAGRKPTHPGFRPFLINLIFVWYWVPYLLCGNYGCGSGFQLFLFLPCIDWLNLFFLYHPLT